MKGITTAANKAGNDLADQIADLGVQQGHFEGAHKLVAYYAHKQTVYQIFLQRIHRLILGILKAETKERQEREATARAAAFVAGVKPNKHITIPAEYVTDNFGEGRTLQLLFIQKLHFAKEEIEGVRMIRAFLMNHQFKPCVAGQNGTSWHELLALFHLKGGHLNNRSSEKDILELGTSLRQDLIRFKMLVRSIINKYAGPADTTMFRPARCKQHRLASYGITSHIPCISAKICLSDKDKKALHEAIALLAGLKMTEKNATALHQGAAQVLPKNIKQRGRAPWLEQHRSNALLELAQKQERTEKGHNILERQGVRPRPQLVLVCQHCGTERDFHSRCPIANGRWISLVCQPCNTISTINKWHCVCNTPWHTCQQHAPIGFQISKPPKRTLSKLTKRRPTPKLSPLGICGGQPVKRVHHKQIKDLNHSRDLEAATGHKPQVPRTTTTANRRQRLAVPTHLCTDPTLASSQKLQRYLERGDVIKPKASSTGTSECAGRRAKVKAAEVFSSTTERLYQKLRQSLASRNGGDTTGCVECESQHFNMTSSSVSYV